MTERGGRTFRGSRIARQGQFHYNAVLEALAADEEVKPALKYSGANFTFFISQPTRRLRSCRSYQVPTITTAS
ncbi:MAG: hypothetical protein ACLSH6_08070 [Limosilactobacillus pontis]